jgi:predicted nuclease with TOPRIM domain
LSGYKFKFIKIPIGYGRGRGYNLVPSFTDEEVQKFIQTSNLIADKGLDKAIKEVWGDLNTFLEEERESELSFLRHSLGRLNSSQLALKIEVKSLSSENVTLRQRVYTLETKLSDLIDKLSTSKKLKKLIE